MKGESEMVYEEPKMEICVFVKQDIATLSGYPSGAAGSGEFENIFGNGGTNGNF